MPEVYYPGASRVQWFGGLYPGQKFSSLEKIVLHSTEGTGWPSYKNGASAPHFTARADFDAGCLRWRQHFKISQSSRALRNRDGGVQTNNDHTIQVELVGTCDRSVNWSLPHLRMWDLPLWAERDLAKFLRWFHDEWGIAYAVPDKWPRYPSSPSLDRQARMSGSRWNAFRGVCGHLHVPENTHLDPGDLPIRRIIDIARGSGGVSAQDVVTGLQTKIVTNRGGTKKQPEWSVADVLGHLEEGQDKNTAALQELTRLVAAQQAVITTMSAAVAALAESSPEGVRKAFEEGRRALQEDLATLDARIVVG